MARLSAGIRTLAAALLLACGPVAAQEPETAPPDPAALKVPAPLGSTADIRRRTGPLEPSGPRLEEAFVELRVSRTRGSSFYRVLVDAHETPYLDMEEILGRWLDLAADCRPARRYCQAVMQPSGRVFWIDGETGELGEGRAAGQAFPREAMALAEGRLWLRQDVWAQWLPVSTTWTLWSYTLGLRPHFPLREDLEKAREEQRRRQEAQRRHRAWLAEQPVHAPPNDALRAEGRFRVVWTQPPEGDDSARIDYDLAADIGGGTAALGANHLFQRGRDGGHLEFWRYRRLEGRGLHLFEAGDTRYDSGTLISAFNLENGVRADRLERLRGAGIFSLRHHTQPGTRVDMYRNGFLEETLTAGDDGFFEIAERFVSGGDRITLYYYFPDGSERTEQILISRDNAMILPKGEWDLRGLAGEVDSGGFAHAGGRYGIATGLSAGLHAFRFPDPLRGGTGGGMLDVAYRPVYGLTLLADVLASGAGSDFEVSADLTGLPHNTFQYELRRLTADSPVRALPAQQDTQRELWRVRHILRWWRLGWRGAYQETDVDRQLDGALDLRLAPGLSARGRSTWWWKGPNDDTYRAGVGVVQTVGARARLELDRNWDLPRDTWSAAFRLQSGPYGPLDALVRAQWPDGGDPEYNASVTWRATPRIWLTLLADQTGTGAQLTWQDIVAPSPGPARWEEFGTGTLSGQVLTPRAPGQPPLPVQGAVVRSDLQRVVTGADGRYTITGLPVHQRVTVRVDANSLDAAMAPVDREVVFRFRPGTHMVYNPPLTWTAGLDGTLRPLDARAAAALIPEEARVRAVRLSDGSEAAVGPLEADGFFILEGLTPGAYELRVTGMDPAPPPLPLELPPDTDWLSGLDWPWRAAP